MPSRSKGSSSICSRTIARPTRQHPFNDPRYDGASILVVNSNFGCGSSREHAPQGLVRAGIRAIIGESFSEIFLGNSAMLGMPCFVAEPRGIEQLQSLDRDDAGRS